jgi:cobalt-zinc-cadmium efflux system protein
MSLAHAHDHHGHSHAHPHGHAHSAASFGRAFLIGTVLNLGFVTIEAGYGILANSVALLADAGHNLSDVLGLLVAWGAAGLALYRPNARFTYGLRRSSIMAALLNAVFLLIAIGAIGVEAAMRLAHPTPVATGTVMTVAAAGILVNGATAALFARGGGHDINIRAAFLHMAGDAMVSAGVVVAGLIIRRTGWLWLDPAVSLAIAVIILLGTWRVLRESVAMSLDAVPDGIDSERVGGALAGLAGVERVHDLHIWAMSTTEVALTCHLYIPSGYPGDAFLRDAAHMLEHDFDIHHVTIQVETRDEEDCKQAAHHAL